MSPAWPGHQVDLAAAAYWARQIAAGLAAAAIVRAVTAAWRAANANGSTDPAGIAMFLASQGINGILARALAPLVRGVHADGFQIGLRAATGLVEDRSDALDGFEPGDAPQDGSDAALVALQGGEYAAVEAMAATRVDQLARALADAVRRGETAQEITDLIGNRLGDPSDAYRIALTEITRAQSAASVAVYQRRGVAEHYWVTAGGNVCPLCQENAAQGAVPVGMPFASGDAAPPIHPNDRCALMPLLDRSNDAG